MNAEDLTPTKSCIWEVELVAIFVGQIDFHDNPWSDRVTQSLSQLPTQV